MAMVNSIVNIYDIGMLLLALTTIPYSVKLWRECE